LDVVLETQNNLSVLIDEPFVSPGNHKGDVQEPDIKLDIYSNKSDFVKGINRRKQ